MMRTAYPLAYHITWGTYGTRLHGDDRGTVYRDQNAFGEPIVGRDGDWQYVERPMLKLPPRVLTPSQRALVETVTPSICHRGGWDSVVTAAAGDHVHNVLHADVDGKDVRKWFKRWVGEALSERWPPSPGQRWWAECGSVKWVWTEDYYDRVVEYVRRQRTTR